MQKYAYADFSDAELVEAVELMVSKDDLKIREVAEVLLSMFGYTEVDVREQLASGEYLSDKAPLELAV
ncbi:MAG: hypothetical protein PHI85_05140 [Victivallaceae bacterium]|nr:hypothetical protein [Victivallaceae bacterium]